jgi:cytochrome c-type biogenesis protein CcmH
LRHPRSAPAALLLAAALAAAPAAGAGDPANDPRVREVARQLLCYCGCNTQSIADCACGVARKERAGIQERLDAGASAAALIAEWVDLRGTGILIEPPRRGFNLLGWFLPGAVLLLVGLAIALQVRRWARPSPAPLAAGEAPPPDPRYLEQLRRDLEDLGR